MSLANVEADTSWLGQSSSPNHSPKLERKPWEHRKLDVVKLLDGKILIGVGQFVEEELEGYRQGLMIHCQYRPLP
jgi:hypothetical protein